MINVVNFSGGRTSAYMVHLFEGRRKRDGIKVEYLFCDTGAEHPKTYEFINNVVKHYNIKLTCLRVKVSPVYGVGSTYTIVDLKDCKPDLKPFKEVCEVYGTPSFATPICTREMKLVPSKKYCKERHGKDYLNWLGIRIDEPKRLNIVDKQVDLFATEKKVDKSKANIRYLAGISDYEKQDILDFWESMPFDLDLDEHLGNCVFCVKKGSNKIALAAMDEPEMAAKFIDMIASDSIVRRENMKFDKDVMYRSHQSLSGVVKQYESFDRNELCQTMRSMKRFDAGACSESCEAMFDLFDDV